jgi:hypothetical protein
MAAAYGHTKAGPLRSIIRTPGMRREEREIEGGFMRSGAAPRFTRGPSYR